MVEFADEEAEQTDILSLMEDWSEMEVTEGVMFMFWLLGRNVMLGLDGLME